MPEPNNKLGPIEVQQQLSQYDAMIANIAPIVGTYYTRLIENDIPDDLAYQLVLDWHSIWWHTIMKASRE